MLQAWFMDDSKEDQKAPHKLEPNQPVSLETLRSFGVLHFTFDRENFLEDVNKIASEREYKNRDEITVAPDKLPNYEQKIKTFFEEHLHEDEEIRVCLHGSGYFDVRDPQDRWIRIHITPGNMIILPAGMYHRFTVDDINNYIHVMRLFKEEPKWTPINRPADENTFRRQYLQTLAASA